MVNLYSLTLTNIFYSFYTAGCTRFEVEREQILNTTVVFFHLSAIYLLRDVSIKVVVPAEILPRDFLQIPGNYHS